jgi:hypothetical protein
MLKEIFKSEKLHSEIRLSVKRLANKIFQVFYFCGNQLQRFTNLHLGLFASSPRKAAGYFAAIPLPLNIGTLLKFCNIIYLFFLSQIKQITQIIFYFVKIG